MSAYASHVPHPLLNKKSISKNPKGSKESSSCSPGSLQISHRKQILCQPDLASSTRRMVTAWAQWIPKAATRWESYLVRSSTNSPLFCTAQEKLNFINKLVRSFHNLIMTLYLGKEIGRIHHGFEIWLGLSLQ